MAERRLESWMWSEACALLDEAERMHRRFYRLLATPTSEPAWEPPINVYVSDGTLLIVVAMPGASADGMVVEITPSGLLIEAQVLPPLLTSRASVLRLEVPYGRVRRLIKLPPGRYRLTQQTLSNGCLHIQLTGADQ